MLLITFYICILKGTKLFLKKSMQLEPKYCNLQKLTSSVHISPTSSPQCQTNSDKHSHHHSRFSSPRHGPPTPLYCLGMHRRFLLAEPSLSISYEIFISNDKQKQLKIKAILIFYFAHICDNLMDRKNSHLNLLG